MTRNTTLVVVFFTLFLLAALTPGTAVAQTPDGETPALEEVCSLESGAAFGLCNAYCEAMDCHLAYDEDDTTSPSASATACGRVENRFMQITARSLLVVSCDPCAKGDEGCSCHSDFSCNDENLYCEDSYCVWYGDEF